MYIIVHPQDLAQFFTQVTTLITEVEQLRKENSDLHGEVGAHEVAIAD